MKRAFDTDAFTKQLHARDFSMPAFVDAAVRQGAETVAVGARFFPERAMYWTRLSRQEAEKKGLTLSAIIVDSELVTSDTATLEAAQADLSEWIRIAGLSEIPALRVRLNGVDDQAPRDVPSLAAALAPLMVIAQRYGITLHLTAGDSGLTDEALLALAKALGYTSARVVTARPLSDADAMWGA